MSWRQVMEIPTYWHRQTASEPFFKDVVWSKPETKAHSGKLLVVGGNKHSLTAPGIAYAAATRAGAGTVRVLLPDSVRKTIGKSFDEGEFAPSNPSGSFSKNALGQILDCADWADATLLAGDFGRNSETAVLLEQVVEKYSGNLAISQDSLDYFVGDIGKLTDKDNIVIVASLSQLQKMTRAGMSSVIVQHSMSLQALAGLLNSWSRETKIKILVYHSGNLIYADGGQISTTPAAELQNWEVPLAACVAVWWMQQPKQRFEAVTTAIYDYLAYTTS